MAVTPGIVQFSPAAFLAAFPRFATPPPGFTQSAWSSPLLAPPVQSAPVVSTAAGTRPAGTWYYVVTATGGLGETTPSNEQSATLAAPGEITVNFSLPVGNTGGKIYLGAGSGTESAYFTVAANATSFTDTGASGTAGIPPDINTTAGILAQNFQLATLQLNNSIASIVQDAPTRAYLLNLLVAHITQLTYGIDGQAPTGIVGRISSATQGSVSVQTQFKTQSEAAAYYVQTQWGATYWQSTAIYRTARYVVPRVYETASWGAWPE